MEHNEKPIDELNENLEPKTAQEEITQEENNETEHNNASEADEQNEGQKKNKRGNRGGNGNGQKVKELEANVETLTNELAEMKDKYLRLYAEFDNYRKRTSRETLELQKVAGQGVIKSLLSSVDDFDRAIKIAEMPDSTEIIPEGIKLVYDKLMRALEQQGLSVMETNGVEFNADLHEALTKIPAPTAEMKGKIIDTIERGYMLQDKIIRFPKVIVAE